MYVKAHCKLLYTHVLLFVNSIIERGRLSCKGSQVLISLLGISCLGESHELLTSDVLWKCAQQPKREMSSKENSQQTSSL